MPSNRPTPGQLEERAQPLEVDGRRLRGMIPFGVESRDMGGWREVIEPRALQGANVDDLTLTLEHAGLPIARHPNTLQLEERADGVHWSAEPPRSRQDIVEAVERGDLRAASWRMRVARDEWRGDVRHVHEIAELRDVALTSSPAYPSASIELRSQPHQEPPVPETETVTAPVTPPVVSPAEPTETRSDPTPAEDTPRPATGSLRVGDRVSAPAPRGLAEDFRSRGFPAERAVMPWDEFDARAVTWSASVDLLNQVPRTGAPLGADGRYAWPAFGRVGVGADVTSVAVLSQSARALAVSADVIRAIDATTPKPEVGSTLGIATVPLKQVAAVQSGIPNIYLEQAVFNTTIEGDLRLTINEALDSLVLAAVATAGFHAPGTDALLVQIRKAMTTVQAAGYNPDTIILRPSDSELLDTLVATSAAGEQFYVFGPAQVGPSNLFGLSRRISKSAPEPIVLDSQAFGKLYSGPVSLAKFEENAGSTNTSLVRMELNAAFGVERSAAAVRIAAA